MVTPAHPAHHAGMASGGREGTTLRGFFGVFRYSRRALELVWSTNRALTLALALLTLIAGILPASVAYVGALIVDAVVAAIRAGGGVATRVAQLVVLEGMLVAAIAAAQRGLSLCQSLLRAQLGQRVNVMILEKALTLELQHFEDSEFYDKLTRARREASTRPLSLVTRTFGLVQNGISLVSYGVLLARFSPWAVAVLLLAGLPAFVAEAKFSGDAFRLFRWRSPETRMQIYLETVIAREDHAKEVKLYGLGPRLLERYRDIFRRLYREDRSLTMRRDAWGFGLGLIATAVRGPHPEDGVRFEDVSFTYPGAEEAALEHVTLHLTPGASLALVGENGSGKTTLIKLLTRLYAPTSGRILLDGQDLGQWDESALRERIGVIFQDFARYQMLVGENVGAGDERFFEDEERWRTAAVKGRASEFIETLPAGYRTQLGKWFRDGRELSGGQWQKIALSRAFMRIRADILVLDEPTAAMDAQAESEVFEHFRQLSRERITILISHRFSTVRMADQIAVLNHGRIIERGSHEELMKLNGRYAQLFTLQARGYR